MKSKVIQKQYWILAGVTALILIIITGIGFLLPEPSPPECYQEMVQTMSIQEVSNLLDVTLAELTWLPDDLEITPVITTYPSGRGANGYCVITITYPHPDNTNANFARLDTRTYGGFQLTKMPLSCSWNFSEAGSTGSSCNVEIDSSTTTLDVRVSISPNISPETILQILDGIVTIEPET